MTNLTRSVLTGMYWPSSLSRMGMRSPVTGSMSVMGSADGVGCGWGGTGGGDWGVDARLSLASMSTTAAGLTSLDACPENGWRGTDDCFRRGDFLVSIAGVIVVLADARVVLRPLLVPLITSSIVSSTVLLVPSFSYEPTTKISHIVSGLLTFKTWQDFNCFKK